MDFNIDGREAGDRYHMWEKQNFGCSKSLKIAPKI